MKRCFLCLLLAAQIGFWCQWEPAVAASSRRARSKRAAPRGRSPRRPEAPPEPAEPEAPPWPDEEERPIPEDETVPGPEASRPTPAAQSQPSAEYPDRITLKTGEIIWGRILAHSHNVVLFKSNQGETRSYKGEEIAELFKHHEQQTAYLREYLKRKKELGAEEHSRHLGLAKWCIARGMWREATAELDASLTPLDPALFRDAVTLLMMLRPNQSKVISDVADTACSLGEIDAKVFRDMLTLALDNGEAKTALTMAQLGRFMGGESALARRVTAHADRLETLDKAVKAAAFLRRTFAKRIEKHEAEIRKLETKIRRPYYYTYKTVTDEKKCMHCGGSGRVNQSRCSKCKGKGYTRAKRRRRVRKKYNVSTLRYKLQSEQSRLKRAQSDSGRLEQHARRAEGELSRVARALLSGGEIGRMPYEARSSIRWIHRARAKMK